MGFIPCVDSIEVDVFVTVHGLSRNMGWVKYSLKLTFRGEETVLQNQVQKQLAETLWIEIENAILQSPGVRHSFKKLMISDPKGDTAKYNLSLDIKRMGELIQSAEENRREFSVEAGIFR